MGIAAFDKKEPNFIRIGNIQSRGTHREWAYFCLERTEGKQARANPKTLPFGPF